MDDDRMLLAALGEATTLNLIVAGIIQRLLAKKLLDKADISSIRQDILLELTDQAADPAGPGSAAVARVRERLDRLLPPR